MGKIALTAAIMDMCHAGHINLLEQMRERANVSIVVLHSDESCWRIKHKVPVQHLSTRIRNLEITGLVDHILVTELDNPAAQFIAAFEMYYNEEFVFMRGDDNLDFPGKHTIDYYGVPIEYISYTEGVNSSDLREALR